ncbi:hypothetical protein ACH5RR_037542 [Cinchona calisaya]|uniref:Protein kinase domain-containing protein n=1 Tax=Cinchona calisaya TaxID=153742 RepID=A0ABD2Y7T3_9GENT
MVYLEAAVMYPYRKMEYYTDNFNEQNFIGNFQFGKFYRGVIKWMGNRKQPIVVKVWDTSTPKNLKANQLRLMNELILFQHEKIPSHPGMVVKLYGFCSDGKHLAIIYEIKPLDTVYNLIPKANFTWLQRVKVAVGLARMLRSLHSGRKPFDPFVVGNIDAAHVMVDEECNPRLLDFGMICGGIFPKRQSFRIYGCDTDPCMDRKGELTEKTDVFAFGVVLLCLITKTVYVENGKSDIPSVLYEWAWTKYKSYKSGGEDGKSDHLLVHQSLSAEPDYCSSDGCTIVNLGMKCIDNIQSERPTMKQVYKQLLKLEVVKHHANFVGLE